ncbi:trigger factor [Hymenobacter sp. 15J16-1T3B]|uniref:trigger factor n=1 Tax=Hymenobacter sp. 15J16-1T3B TaxID=2886941 RepID=UPI001D113A4A|nr:trigger factor [Hymenobacter sp. 15J16-1T3B]MCC3157581.1 trigger factor [Hymenobacter sp. 15J16-1T3B]
MDITLDNKDEQQGALLTVRLTEADYSEAVEKQIKDVSKRAQIKGFRPGKVPAALVRKMYGKGVLVDEINKQLNSAVDTYIKENKLRLLGDPLPVPANVDFDTQKDFEFQFELGLVPDFSLPTGDGFEVERPKVELDQNTLDETYEQIGRQFGENTNPETAEAGDYISGQLKQETTEFSQKVLLPTNKLKNGADKFVGVKAGDVVTFDLKDAFGGDATLIANFTGLSKELAAGVDGEYTFEVEQIHRSKQAEYDQELFDKVFGKDIVTSKEDFDAKVRETIQENYDRESNNVLNRRLIQKIVDSTEINLPKEFFKKWLVAANQGKLTKEQVEENYADYEKELKWSLIRNKVVEDQGLKVSNEEIMDRTMDKILAQFNMPEVSEELRESVRGFADNYLRQENGKNYVQEYEAILADKVVDSLRGQIVVKDQPMTAEDFRSNPQA